MNSIIVIPARLESTRLPRKLLLRETGQTLLEHTYRAACKSRLADQVIVAADSPEIVDAVTEFGGIVKMTDSAHQSGTDRIAEVMKRHADVDVVVNVQGDEPEIEFEAIDRAIALLREHPEISISTLATPIRSREQLRDPSCVKVVLDRNNRALYFSRSAIPFARTDSGDDHALPRTDDGCFLQHIGLYAYRPEFLQEISRLPQSPLERLENLEQLRFLEAGFSIIVGIVDHHGAGIDTREDYAAFVSRQQS